MFWIFKIKKCKSAGNTSPNINLEKAGEIIAELFVKKMYSGMSETEVKTEGWCMKFCQANPRKGAGNGAKSCIGD